MKKTYFWMMALCIAGALAACSDDDNKVDDGEGDGGGETPVVYKTVASVVKTTPMGEMFGQVMTRTETFSYTYDADGKLTGYTGKDETTGSLPNSETVTYTYSGNTVTMTGANSRDETYTPVVYTLDGGKIKSSVEEEGSDKTTCEVAYDANGCVKTVVTTDVYEQDIRRDEPPYDIIGTETVTEKVTETFVFEGGNLKEYTWDNNDNEKHKVYKYTFGYLSGKYENRGTVDVFSQFDIFESANEMFLLNLIGKRSVQLPVRITSKYLKNGEDMSDEVINITYTTNKDGDVIEFTRDDDDEGVKYNVNYK